MVAQSISVAKITADITSIVHYEAQCAKKSKYTQKTKHNSHNWLINTTRTRNTLNNDKAVKQLLNVIDKIYPINLSVLSVLILMVKQLPNYDAVHKLSSWQS